MNRFIAHHRTAQRGLTLVELMVSVVLGLFLVSVVSLVYLQTAGGTRFSTLEAQMNEEGALALELLRSQLSLAGFSSVNPATDKRAFTGLPVWGCDKGFTDTDVAFGSSACKATGTANDAIAVGYEATALNSITTGPTSTASNCANEAIAAAGAIPIADNRFYVGNDTDGNPSLYCRGKAVAAFGNSSALVPNIERLRLRYAITRATTRGEVAPHQVTALVDASDLITEDDWARVAAVDVCLLVRSEQPVPPGGLSADEITRHVDCDGQVRTAADGRLRRAYRTLVPLPNVRPQVPRPYQIDAGVVSNPYAAAGE